MPIAHRARVLALSVLVAALSSSGAPASARPDEGEVRKRPARATAGTRGLEVAIFGSRVSIGSSTAAVSARPAATARAAGVAAARRSVAAAQVEDENRRKAANACVPSLAVAELVDVREACGESRVQTLPPLFTEEHPVHPGAALLGPASPSSPREVHTGSRPGSARVAADNGGPQAVGRSSVAGVDLRGGDILEREVARWRTMPTVLANVPAETLAAVERSAPLVSIKLTPATAQVNTTAEKVVCLAAAADGQIDLLPGAGPGDAPLLSVTFTGARSTSTFERQTAGRLPALEPATARVRLGLPLLGTDVTDLPVESGRPVTVLAGTPLETTVSVGGGRHVTKEDGSVSAVGEGVRVQTLTGVRGGLDIRVGHAETSVAASAAAATGSPNRRPWVLAASLALAGSLLLLAATVRARGRATTPPRRGHAVVPPLPSSS